ncbi:MAG: Fur family transcriptional regulator [Solirubrobacteraceae bacterium]
MTVAPQTPALSFTTIEEAIAAVRGRGMRLSTARRLVLEALFGAEGPVSAVHLAQELSIDATSVYRNLEVLERHGLIRHVHLGHGPGLYVLVGRHELEYLYCEHCASVTPVSPEQLDPLRGHLREAFGYEARFTHFAIVGLCPRCQAEPRSGVEADALDGVQLGAPTAERGADPDSEQDWLDLHRPRHHRSATEITPDESTTGDHEHLHSHGDHVHSHPHVHAAAADEHTASQPSDRLG